MKKSLFCYYEELAFDLNMDLHCTHCTQNMRHELANMLDAEFNDCIDCHQLRLQNMKKMSKSTTASRTSSDSGVPSDTDIMPDIYIAAPSADTLPKPKWGENKTSSERKKAAKQKKLLKSVEIWVRASLPHIQSGTSVSFPVPRTVLDEINYSWPPFPESIWSNERMRETTAREQILLGEQEGDVNSSVVEFFSHFGNKQAIPKTALV